MGRLLSCFSVILREIDLENVSPSVRWNLRGFCLHIDCRWQISCSRFCDFATPKWNEIIWKTKNFFFNFLLHLWNPYQIFNILEKKMIVIANVFLKLETVKILVRPLSKKHRFRTRFDSERVKASQILPKSPWEHFYHVFHHSEGNWFGKCLP